MSIQAKLDAERPARVLASYSDKERRTFATILQILKNQSKQVTLFFELVETLAFQKLKENVEPKEVTMEQHQQLHKCIPWVFVETELPRSQWNTTTYAQLKKHFKAIAKILENVKEKQCPANCATVRTRHSVVPGVPEQ